MKKDKEIFGLNKIPQEAVIAELRQELGKANAYIGELEDALKKMETNNERKLKNDLKSMKCTIKQLAAQIVELRQNDDCKRLRKTISELTVKNVALEKELKNCKKDLDA